jgi:hypothetical protein
MGPHTHDFVFPWHLGMGRLVSQVSTTGLPSHGRSIWGRYTCPWFSFCSSHPLAIQTSQEQEMPGTEGEAQAPIALSNAGKAVAPSQFSHPKGT